MRYCFINEDQKTAYWVSLHWMARIIPEIYKSINGDHVIIKHMKMREESKAFDGLKYEGKANKEHYRYFSNSNVQDNDCK